MTVAPVVMSIIGTRPEAIKMAPVIRRLQQCGWCTSIVVATAQHRDLLDRVLARFGIAVDVDLDIMTPAQTLAQLSTRLIAQLDAVIEARQPQFVLAQGDTTTAMMAALVAFYRRIPFGHVEAGLRTGDLGDPFPEELNRIVADRVAALHFAPTAVARDALLREGHARDGIFVTGNTVVDALREAAAAAGPLPVALPPGRRVVLFTMHRRENFGAPLQAALGAVRTLAEAYDDIAVVCPVHPNPEVDGPARRLLAGHPRIHLLAPLDYPELAAVLGRAVLVLTDSGGLQEESSILGKPVLILRAATERGEGIAAGVAKLIGCDPVRIVAEASRLLDDRAAYAAMARPVMVYGDGRAAQRIVDILRRHLVGLPRETVDLVP